MSTEQLGQQLDAMTKAKEALGAEVASDLAKLKEDVTFSTALDQAKVLVGQLADEDTSNDFAFPEAAVTDFLAKMALSPEVSAALLAELKLETGFADRDTDANLDKEDFGFASEAPVSLESLFEGDYKELIGVLTPAEKEGFEAALESGGLSAEQEAQLAEIKESFGLLVTKALELELPKIGEYLKLSTAEKITFLKDVVANGGTDALSQQLYAQEKLRDNESERATAAPNQAREKVLARLADAPELKKRLLPEDPNAKVENLKANLEKVLDEVLISITKDGNLSALATELGKFLGISTQLNALQELKNKDREADFNTLKGKVERVSKKAIAGFDKALTGHSVADVEAERKAFLTPENIKAMIASVPESELETEEFNQWVEALKAAKTSLSYEDYLTTVIMPKKEGMEAWGLQLRLTWGPFIKMIKEFMKQFSSITGSGEDKDAAADEAARIQALRNGALEKAAGLEEGSLDRQTKVKALGTYVASSPGLTVIDFMKTETGGTLAFDEGKADAYLKSVGEDAETPESLAKVKNDLLAKHPTLSSLLAKGVSLRSLVALKKLPDGYKTSFEAGTNVLSITKPDGTVEAVALDGAPHEYDPKLQQALAALSARPVVADPPEPGEEGDVPEDAGTPDAAPDAGVDEATREAALKKVSFLEEDFPKKYEAMQAQETEGHGTYKVESGILSFEFKDGGELVLTEQTFPLLGRFLRSSTGPAMVPLLTNNAITNDESLRVLMLKAFAKGENFTLSETELKYNDGEFVATLEELKHDADPDKKRKTFIQLLEALAK